MNNLKRIISMLLCMALMFTSVSVFADETVTEEITATEETVATEETAETTEDAATEEVAEIAVEEPVEEPVEEVEPIEIDWERIGLLETLGIIDEVDEATAQEFLTAQFSRAEFAVALVKFNNMEDIIGVGEGFNDVVPGSKEEPYINAAVNMGLIAAVTDGYFYPQYPISYKDAAQAFVMSLGYTAMAEINDSWLIQAKKLGLMSGVDTGAAFTRAQAYRMFYNALHAEIMDVTGIEGSISNYETREGVDALYKFFNVKHEEGIITAAGGIELAVGSTANKEYIKHNGKLYKYGPHSMNEYLGRNAVVYYSETGEARYVLRDKNEVLHIPQSELNGYNNLTYNYGADEKTAKIANGYVIKNGKEYLGSYTQSAMEPVSGSVTLIDNNRDGVYEIVFIDEYVDYVIKLKMQNPRRIVDVFGNSVTIDPNSSNVELYDEKGKDLAFDKLSTNTVASVMQSTSSVRVYISTKTVTDAISQTSQKLGKNVWRIQDKDYTLSKSLIDAIAGGQIDNVKIGQAYKFYLNIYDEIAYYEKAEKATGDGKFYAFITAAKADGIDGNEVSIKAYAKEFGGFQSLTVPKRITLNGSNASPSRVYNSLMRDGVDGRVSDDGKIIAQPVILKVNENNEITYLSQASVAQYYKELYEPVFDNGSGKIVDFVQLGNFPAPEDPSYKAEFRLITGHYNQAASAIAYRGVIQQPFFEWVDAADTTKYPSGYLPHGSAKYDKDKGYVFVKQETHHYNDLSSGYYFYTQIGNTAGTIYQVPYYKTGANQGRVAVDKEQLFKTQNGLSGSGGGGFCMYAYAEGDSVEASYVTYIVDAETPSTVGDEFNLHLVTEISRAYVNEAPVTVVKTNERTLYIEEGTIDINAVKLYDYNNNPVYEADGVTWKTYQVKPGDIINAVVDTLGYITAIDPVFDSSTYKMLGVGGSQSEDYFAKRTTQDLTIKRMSLMKLDGKTMIMVRGEAPGDSTDLMDMCAIPNSVIKVENVRGKITTTSATKADMISYEDSSTEYVTILMVARFSALQNPLFLYPNPQSWQSQQ